MIFILVISFYLIKDTDSLLQWIESLVPTTYRDDFIQLRSEINLIWEAFFRGQLMLAFIVATIFTLAGFIIGLPFALTMGVLAGLLEFLPSLGHGIWLIIASLLSLFIGSTWLPLPNWAFALLVIGLHLFYQQFDLNYLIPRVDRAPAAPGSAGGHPGHRRRSAAGGCAGRRPGCPDHRFVPRGRPLPVCQPARPAAVSRLGHRRPAASQPTLVEKDIFASKRGD